MKQTRISPEAPIPIVEEQEYFAELGGAGNALRHLSNLSKAHHFLIGIRGPDSVGDEMASLKGLNAGQMDLMIDPARRTTVKERVYIDGLPIFRKDSEDVTPLNQEIEAEILLVVSNRIEDFDVLLLSDYAKGLLTQTLVTSLLSLAKVRKKPIVSDPGLGRVAFFAGCDVIKPNEKEWKEFVQTRQDEAEALDWLFAHGTQFVVVTHGKNGISCFSAGQSIVAAAADEIEAVDVTGAGDSVAAIVSLIVGSGKKLVDYLDKLNQVGGLTVAQTRTSLPKI